MGNVWCVISYRFQILKLLTDLKQYSKWKARVITTYYAYISVKSCKPVWDSFVCVVEFIQRLVHFDFLAHKDLYLFYSHSVLIRTVYKYNLQTSTNWFFKWTKSKQLIKQKAVKKAFILRKSVKFTLQTFKQTYFTCVRLWIATDLITPRKLIAF